MLIPTFGPLCLLVQTARLENLILYGEGQSYANSKRWNRLLGKACEQRNIYESW
jgi:hypothetical protein